MSFASSLFRVYYTGKFTAYLTWHMVAAPLDTAREIVADGYTSIGEFNKGHSLLPLIPSPMTSGPAPQQRPSAYPDQPVQLRDIFRRFASQPAGRVIELINPILRGWVNHFAVGHSSRCFSFVKDWVEKKVRRHLMRARQRKGFGWQRWSRKWLYEELGLYKHYRVHRPEPC